jgi:hypothetical protein
MSPIPAKVELVIEGNRASAQYKETMALLDHSGLAYRIGPEADSPSTGAPCLRWGDETLTDVSKDKVVDFLWAHGAQFEDS